MSYFDPSDQYKKPRPAQKLRPLILPDDPYKQRTLSATPVQQQKSSASRQPTQNTSGPKRPASKTAPRMPKAKALTLVARLKKGVVAASFLCFGTIGIVIMRHSTTTTAQSTNKVTTSITTPVVTSIATPTVTSGSTPTAVATSTPTPIPTATSTSSGGYGFGSSNASQSPVTSTQSS
jgi:hypothetical protein